jgi:hypothetical protein
VFNQVIATVTREVVGVFVRFRAAPLQRGDKIIGNFSARRSGDEL